MTPLTAYVLKVLLCSGILYAYYHVALRNNRFHQWNRCYLLLATLLSLTLPLLEIPLSFNEKEPSAINLYTTQIITLREFILPAAPSRSVNYMQLAIAAYGLVALCLLARTLIGFWKIKRLIAAHRVQQVPPYHFVLSPQIRAPFSFFRYIFWSPDISLNSREGQQILRHELAHVTGRHSTDKLLLEIVCAVCWINPFFYLLKREMTMVHEFIADKVAAGEDMQADYAQTILQLTLQTRQLSLTNSFFHPPVKRRIQMLFTKKSNFSIMKKFIVFPLVTALFVFISCQRNNRADVAPDENVKDITMKELVALNIDDQYITSMNLQTDDNKKTTVTVKTRDRKTYRVKDFNGDLLDGVKTLPPPPPPPAPAPGGLERDKEVFTFVENPPTYPGGEAELALYLNRSIRYPREAQENGVSATIFVQFIVGADGSIREVKTVGKPKGFGLEEETVRVVNNMPKWIAGTQNGKQVAVQFNLPIRYNIQN